MDANLVDLTLAGPKLLATGSVKSVIQGAKPGRGGTAERRVPSMLKEDKPVNVTADALDYDGSASKAVYSGSAQLWQDETSIKGKTIVLDEKTGDVSAALVAHLVGNAQEWAADPSVIPERVKRTRMFWVPPVSRVQAEIGPWPSPSPSIHAASAA